jgi:outer membrane immunogenic protein
MKKLIVGLVAIGALIAAPAMAADLRMPVKAPPAPIAPAFSWTGFYLGIDGGYGWNDSTGDRTCVNPGGVFFGPGCTQNIQGHVISPSGGLFGGTAGYNVQGGNFVYGIETDIQWSNISASATVPIGVPAPTGSYTATDKLNWFGTARGRIGFLATPQLLAYVTGGLIYGNESVTAITFFPSGFNYPAALSTTRTGGVVGGGLEYAFANNFSAKVEGLYYDMGTLNIAFTCPTGSATCSSGFTEGGTFAERGFIVRGGLNWHFNFGGPVATRY